MKRVHLQPGLGDAVYALPFVFALAEKFGGVEMRTAHNFVFERVPGVKFSRQPLAYRKTDVRFQWTRILRRSFYAQYERDAGLPGDFEKARAALTFQPSEILRTVFLRARESGKPLCVLGEARAAERHKAKQNFKCAPLPGVVSEWVDEHREKFYFVTVGANEVFAERRTYADRDLCDKLTPQEFVTLIRCADVVASQVSCFIALAATFQKTVKIFPGREDTPDFHARHEKFTTCGQVVFL